MEESSNEPKSRFINKVMFIFFGIAALLGWNAILTELDYFTNFLGEMDPPTSFPFLNYILNISFQFILILKKDLIPLKLELTLGILGSIVMLILIPLSSSLLGINELRNKIITGALLVIMGLINAFASGGFFSYAGHFPIDMIVIFTLGQGISAILLNILQYIVLASINITDIQKKYIISGWIFFGFSIIILIVCYILLLLSYKDDYCKYFLDKVKNSQTSKTRMTGLLSKEERNEENEVQIETKEEEANQENEEIIQLIIEPSFSYIFKKLWLVDILACYAYILTFALFPKVSMSQTIFDIGEYNGLTIITIYNVFDTIGRYAVKLFKSNKILDMIIVFGRSILIFTVIFNGYCQKVLDSNLTFTSIFLIINTALLGITNGMAATLTFAIASEIAEDNIKKQAGGSIGFFSIFGIFLGTCVAFGTSAIVDSFE